MDDDQAELAARLRAARVYAGMTHDALASALGVSKTTLRRLERGEKRVDAVDVRRIAELTGVPDGWLVDGKLQAPVGDEGAASPVHVLKALRSIDRRLDDIVARLERIEARDR